MNLALYYIGGSGGFYALWHLLLGTDAQCNWSGYTYPDEAQKAYNCIRGSDWPDYLPENFSDLPINVQQEIEQFGKTQELTNLVPNRHEIYNTHWDIKNKNKWKVTEIWPDNDSTYTSNIENKIYFYCNPKTADFHKHKHDLKILLYTDIRTQTTLARNKHAWKWFDGKAGDDNIIETMMYKDQLVSKSVCTTAHLVDHSIKLQDVVRTTGNALLELVGSTSNNYNHDHNTQWLNLHTQEERKLLES